MARIQPAGPATWLCDPVLSGPLVSFPSLRCNAVSSVPSGHDWSLWPQGQSQLESRTLLPSSLVPARPAACDPGAVLCPPQGYLSLSACVVAARVCAGKSGCA